MRNISRTISQFFAPTIDMLTAPKYTGHSQSGIGLAVESMKRHMTDEGWQIFEGLEQQGYTLYGHGLPNSETNVKNILSAGHPGIVVMQDKREWDVSFKDFREKEARFSNVGVLSDHDDIFKLTILKDSHQRPEYHRDSAAEIGCHAWIIYYHPRIVKALAPYVREEHLVRTYHTLDRTKVPKYSPKNRRGCLLSGACSRGAYPWRWELIKQHRRLPETDYLQHPGYHKNGSQTGRYMETLSSYKVAICTSSLYGYALRKIIEATACGCVVITDLPEDEVLPYIDGNLVRMSPQVSVDRVANKIVELCASYDEERQQQYAEMAVGFYNHHSMCSRLADDIEKLRSEYNQKGANRNGSVQLLRQVHQ